jgi:hypothetical protein
MPTLKKPSIIDTSLPGLTRRRIWQMPAVRSHSLITLTLAKLYLAPLADTVKPETVQAIENGADLEATFGPLGTVVDLDKVQRVKLDLIQNTLVLEYARSVPSGSGASGMPLARVVMEFVSAETADEVYSKVWRRLSDQLEQRENKNNGWELARVPVAFTAGILLATLSLSLVANAVADTQAASGLLKPFASADWRIVCGIGGVAMAAIQIWLYRRMNRPPTLLELVPKALGPLDRS